MTPDTNDKLQWLTLPNGLTCFRFIAAPILLWFAWNDYAIAFMVLLAVAFLSDLLDGFAARLLGQVSQFGATLDSWADVINYLTIAVCCWWLWPEIVLRERWYVIAVVGSCLVPAAMGFFKFGCFTSYHTWSVKLAAASMGISLYIMFLGGPAWPFRVAALLCLVAAFEEMAISFMLKQPQTNVHSIWHILKHRRQSSGQ